MKVSRIVIHCTATRPGAKVDAAVVRGWHTAPVSKGGRGWRDIGYHYVILPDGRIEKGRADNVAGAHVAGFNTGSLGIVYVGGLDASGRPADTRTAAQKAAMAGLVRLLVAKHPGSAVMGHRDLSPDRDGDGVVERHEWLKECPCFDVRAEAPRWLAGGVATCPTCKQAIAA